MGVRTATDSIGSGIARSGRRGHEPCPPRGGKTRVQGANWAGLLTLKYFSRWYAFRMSLSPTCLTTHRGGSISGNDEGGRKCWSLAR